MEQLSPLVAAGGVIGLFSAAAALVIQLFRQNIALGRERDNTIKRLETDVHELKQDNTALKHENFACRIQVNGLCNVLRDNGLKIPDWLFRRSEVPGAE